MSTTAPAPKYVDNEGHVIRYARLPPQAPRFRLLTFEIAPPGTEQFKPYIQARLHRGPAG